MGQRAAMGWRATPISSLSYSNALNFSALTLAAVAVDTKQSLVAWARQEKGRGAP